MTPQAISQPIAAPKPALKESPQRWWLATLLFTGMFLVYAQRGALSVAAPFLGSQFHLDTAKTGLLLSAFFWSYCLMQIPSGVLADRLGPRRVYAVGMLVCALATMMVGLAAGLVTLLILRILVGLGQGVSFPASSGVVATSFPDRERGTITAIYLCGVRMGQAAVTAIGGLLIPQFGWKFVFLVVGIVSLVWVLPWNLFVRRWEQPKAVSQAKAPVSFTDSLRLFRQKSVMGIVLGFFAYDYTWFLYTSWLPAYLTSERHFTPKEMAFYGSTPYLVMSVAIVLSGMGSDALIRAGYNEITVRKIGIAVGLALAGLIVPAGLVDDKMMSVWLIMLSMCGLGICVPNAWTLTQAVCDKRIVGTVSGIQNFGGNVGGILSPAITGYIAHVTHSFAWALGLTGGILVIGIIAYLALVQERVEA